MSCPYYAFKDNDYHCILCGRDVNEYLYKYKCRDYNYDTCPIYNEGDGVGTCYYDSTIKKVVFQYENPVAQAAPMSFEETPHNEGFKHSVPRVPELSRGRDYSDGDTEGCIITGIIGTIGVIIIIAVLVFVLQLAIYGAIIAAIVFVIALIITLLVSVRQSRKMTDQERTQLDMDEAEYYNKTYGGEDI